MELIVQLGRGIKLSKRGEDTKLVFFEDYTQTMGYLCSPHYEANNYLYVIWNWSYGLTYDTSSTVNAKLMPVVPLDMDL